MSVITQEQISPSSSVQSRSPSLDLPDVESIPWTIWLCVAGILITAVGSFLDVAWHKSVGAEAFWTPGHVLIGCGAGLLTGIAAFYEIFVATRAGRAQRRDTSARIMGLLGPAGAFLTAWGALAMQGSTPFDDWWHRAYGLDLRLLTPPHGLLRLGYYATMFGAMIWIASLINRSKPELRGRLAWMLLIVGGMLVLHLPMFGQATRANMHAAACYLTVALAVPTIMIASGHGSRHKWGCTIVAAVYMGVLLASLWGFPLIPARPKIGPVYHNVTRLMPYPFPLLLIVPAFVTDLLLQRLQWPSSWKKAALIGPAFVLSFLAVQWPFADFLMSPASRNWVFGTHYFGYNDPAGVLFDPYVFKVVEKTTAAFAMTMVAALVAATVTTRLGLAWGDWMRRVRR